MPAGPNDLYVLENAQTGPGAHPASYSVGAGAPFPICKVAAAVG
jgi:hypothetical protein